MTREEAIGRILDHIEAHSIGMYPHIKIKEALDLALTYLRGPTREMVERIRSRWVPLNNTQEHFCESCGVAFNLYAYCKNDYQFCPACGAPMMDEAVDMMLERWKEAM